MYLNIKSEYSFRSTFAPIEMIVERCKNIGFCGITDINNTFAHVPLEKQCEKHNIKPIFGVSIPCTTDLDEKDRRGHLNYVYLVAINQNGLKSIYKLIETAYRQFWFTPRIEYNQLNSLDQNGVLIISGYAFQHDLTAFKNVFQQVSPGFPEGGINNKIKQIAAIENQYITRQDKSVYESFADERLLERKTYPQHLLSHREWLAECGNKKALKNLMKTIKKIENIKLQRAPLVKSKTKNPEEELDRLCKLGAKKLKIDISNDNEYQKRYKREFEIVSKLGFVDYFLLVANLVSESKKKMLVGPGRGSSGGSLVCFLLGITTFDPIKYNLIFERFIDINRTDLPDIDVDFQHDERDFVFRHLSQKYSVSQIANISRLTPKANLNRIAKHLFVPEFELEQVKNMTSDQKANALTIKNIFEETEPGQMLLRKYPRMADCLPLENHALHSSTHAAGILVSNKDLTNYCGINTREKTAMVDMSMCEHLNLLKVDALGLKTLTVLSKTLALLEKSPDFLYYLKDGNKKAYKLINKGDLTGIFQLEGRAIRKLIESDKIKSIEDIAAISSLGRPGPMKSGSHKRYLKRKKGEKYKLPDKHKTIKKITSKTFGVIIYQEQIMQIARDYAGMEWEDVILLRKAVAKSKGAEEIQKLREKFMKGAKGKHPEKIWDMIKTFGAYGFNKSHAVAYAFITYWCAYLKANHLPEFAVSLLNVTENDNQAIQILRYLLEKEKFKFKYYSKHSGIEWKIKNNTIFAPLQSIHGIGIQNARKIIKCHQENIEIPAGIQKHLDNSISPFRYLYPRTELYGDYRGTNIEEIKAEGNYTIICKLLKKKIKDANEIEKVNNRGYEVDGPTTYLNMIVADDTEEIMCIINRFDYDKIGKQIGNDAEEDKTWFKITGKYQENINILFVKKIKDITR